MCRLWFTMLLFGVAVTVVVAEALSRVFEEERHRKDQCPACLCKLGACEGHGDEDGLDPLGGFCPLCQGHAVTSLGY